MTNRVPHARTIIAFCVAAILGYAVFSVWAVFYSGDSATRGDVGGTWKSFAVMAFGFWLGSSSGGKVRDESPTPPPASGRPNDPINVTPAPTAADLPEPAFGPRPADDASQI